MMPLVVMAGCSSNEIGDSKDVAQDKIYQSYAIIYAEGNSNAEIYCQFRFAGKNGTTLVLNDPGQVQFDGKKIKVDSSAGRGAFYQLYQPSNDLFGKHSITFTTTGNKNLVNNFSFGHFKLANLPGGISKKQDLHLNFETGVLEGDDYIEVNSVNTDSSFSITHSTADKGNFIVIPSKELKRQKNKEISVEAILHKTIALQQATTEGGRLSITYTLTPVKLKLLE